MPPDITGWSEWHVDYILTFVATHVAHLRSPHFDDIAHGVWDQSLFYPVFNARNAVWEGKITDRSTITYVTMGWMIAFWVTVLPENLVLTNFFFFRTLTAVHVKDL